MDSGSFGQSRSQDVACKFSSSHELGRAINVGDTERVISTMAGGLAVMYGVSKLSLTSILGLVAGGALIYRGLSGHCSMYGALGMSTACGLGKNEAGAASHPRHDVGETSLAATGESPPVL